jgi:hypothetical protein
MLRWMVPVDSNRRRKSNARRKNTIRHPQSIVKARDCSQSAACCRQRLLSHGSENKVRRVVVKFLGVPRNTRKMRPQRSVTVRSDIERVKNIFTATRTLYYALTDTGTLRHSQRHTDQSLCQCTGIDIV